MEKWESWVLDQMRQHRPLGREWPAFLPRPEGY
jgi:hypothetical protein